MTTVEPPPRSIDAPRLVLLPGLGVDGRLYGPQRALPVRLEVVEWPEPESQDETLAHYSARLAAGIRGGGDAYIGGVSLGAMVALEAAKHLDVRGVFLIGGCRSHRQLSAMFKGICTLAGWMPRRLIRPSLALAPPAFKLFEGLNADQIRLMTTMLRESPPERTRWSARAIMGWECGRDPPAPIHVIHGERDEVIPLKSVRPDHVVKEGRHLISLAHAGEVNRFLLNRLLQGPSAWAPAPKELQVGS